MFHLDLKLLRSFAAVAAECSVTRAAARLGLTQPTVSGQIKELEAELGFVLFHRTTRRIDLSEHGQRLLPSVQTVLRDAELLRIEVEEMQVTKTRQFRLGAAMYTLDLDDRADLLDAFAAAMPDIRYTIDNRLQSAQVPDLVGERLDAALLLGIAAPIRIEDGQARAAEANLITNEVVYPDDLERIVLSTRPIRLLVPIESPLAAYDVIPLDALAGQRVAMLSLEHGEALINPIASFLLRAGVMPISLAEGNALAVERHAMRHRIAAIGIGWFPTPAGMILRPVEDMAFGLDLAIVLGASANKAARRFFAFAKDWQTARERLADRTRYADRAASCLSPQPNAA